MKIGGTSTGEKKKGKREPSKIRKEGERSAERTETTIKKRSGERPMLEGRKGALEKGSGSLRVEQR